jgi:hypothetical protein
MEDIVISVFGPYDDRYFAMAVVYKDIGTEEIDAYMAQILNAMIQFEIVKGAEKLIILSHIIPTMNSHFTFIERFDHRTNKPTREEIVKLSTDVLDNIPVDQSPISFILDYDQAKPIQYYGRAVSVKTTIKALSDSIKSMFVGFPNFTVGYAMTQKINPK